ncbi:TIGR02270 family protein [Sorangium sp. So ce834]|uniref:TIGR02270 family protein n=1 Tax=Sorangium sp. So ce834 TaxID=3133321 RepID=UPI003F644883
MQRELAVDSYAHDLDDVARLDERLDAHLDGLRIAGNAGIETSLRGLARGGEETSAGFAALVLAAERGEIRIISYLLERAGAHPTLGQACAAALGWLAAPAARSWVERFLSSDGPAGWLGVGLTLAAAQRIDPGAALAAAIRSRDVLARRAAARAGGELGRLDLRSALESVSCGDDDAACRFWADWSLVLLGDTSAAGRLLAACEQDGPSAWVAASLAPRRLASDRATDSLHRLLTTPGAERPAIVAAAALGDAAMVPSLIERMRLPRLARLSAWAFHEITGIDIAGAGLAGPRPEGFPAAPSDDPADPAVFPDPEASLPFPDTDRVAAHWAKRCDDFPPGVRLILGRPPTDAWLRSVLVTGRQPTRMGAALEMVIRAPGRPLFPTRAPARRQLRRLGVGGSRAGGSDVAAS